MKSPRYCGNWAMPATVATSKLPKWPVSNENAFALLMARRGDSIFSTRIQVCAVPAT